MCWFAYGQKKAEIHPITAKSDLKCYKVMRLVDGQLYSKFKNFHYEAGKCYDGLLLYEKDGSINYGFHSYSGRCLVGYKPESSEKGKDFVAVYSPANYWRHENITMEPFRGSLSLIQVIVACIIPKGSTYYKSNIGTIASDSIILQSADRLFIQAPVEVEENMTIDEMFNREFGRDGLELA